MYAYQEVKRILIEKAKIPEDEIFDFEFSPYKDEFEGYFEYFQRNLSEGCEGYDIQPALFYFTPYYSRKVLSHRTIFEETLRRSQKASINLSPFG